MEHKGLLTSTGTTLVALSSSAADQDLWPMTTSTGRSCYSLFIIIISPSVPLSSPAFDLQLWALDPSPPLSPNR